MPDQRTLGRSGIKVSALGLGCWAIGGPYSTADGKPCGWGQVDDAQSIRAIRHAFDLGITFFDTAECYGCGHSERILGIALAGKRDQVVIATKFWHRSNEHTRVTDGTLAGPHEIAGSCEDSLRRLGTDYIDLFQFHQGNYPAEQAAPIRDACEALVRAGKIRCYGWSTDDPARAAVFADGPTCAAIQQRFNVFDGDAGTLRLCEKRNLASIIRSPLLKGLLTGKFTRDSTFPANDVRAPWWNLRDGQEGQWLHQLEQLRDILTSGGRTLAQGALTYLWSISPVTIPIPGFKTITQVEENAGAMRFDLYTRDQLHQIHAITGRELPVT